MQISLPKVNCTPNMGYALNTEYQNGSRIKMLTIKCYHQIPANVGLKNALVGVYWNTVPGVIVDAGKELGLVGFEVTSTIQFNAYTILTVVIPPNYYWKIINYDTNGGNSTIAMSNEVLI